MTWQLPEGDDAIHAYIRALAPDVRWWMATEGGLPIAAYQALLDMGEEAVLGCLATNPEIPVSILGELTEREDDIGILARESTRAPADAKERSPIGNHSSYGIDLFLEERRATPEQTRALRAEYDRAPHPGGRLLGDVWREIQETHPHRA